MKKLSIIIPVYNAQDHIRTCLDSISRQLRKEYEIILIDDGSRDSSLDILKEYERQYPGSVRVIAKENEGVAKTRNLGIREAAGEYLCFIDNDDFVDKNYFENFLTAIEQDKCDIVIGGYRRVEGDKIRFQVKPVASAWYKFMVAAPWAKIFRRSFLINNGIEFLDYGLGEDVYFSLVAYAKTRKIKVVDYIGYNWYFNQKSVSNTSQRGFSKELDPLYLLEKIYNEVGSGEILYSYYYIRYGIWYHLFSGRQSTKEKFLSEYKKLFLWYEKRNVPCKFPIFSRAVLAEKLATRCMVGCFLIFHKFKLVKLFAKFYCIGENSE